MTLEEKTDEANELKVDFPRLLTSDETTRLLDYFTSEGAFVAEYVVQQAVTSGRLGRENGKRKWISGTKPAGIYGNIHLIDQPDLTVLFDCEMELVEDGLRFKNISFGLPSEETAQSERAKEEIIGVVRSLAKTYF